MVHLKFQNIIFPDSVFSVFHFFVFLCVGVSPKAAKQFNFENGGQVCTFDEYKAVSYLRKDLMVTILPKNIQYNIKSVLLYNAEFYKFVSMCNVPTIAKDLNII